MNPFDPHPFSNSSAASRAVSEIPRRAEALHDPVLEGLKRYGVNVAAPVPEYIQVSSAIDFNDVAEIQLNIQQRHDIRCRASTFSESRNLIDQAVGIRQVNVDQLLMESGLRSEWINMRRLLNSLQEGFPCQLAIKIYPHGGRMKIFDGRHRLVASKLSRQVNIKARVGYQDQDEMIQVFIVDVTKGPQDVVGLDVDWGDMERLRITKIKEGLLSKWNTANPNKIVRVDDYIMKINNTQGDAKAMLDVVKTNAKLVLVISRS